MKKTTKIKKKFKVTSETTFGQARQYGIKLKEFKRRQKISSNLKLYYKSSFSEKKTIKTRSKITKKAEKQAELIPEIRIRKQVVANFRPNFDDYDESIGGIGAISIRAITINPEYNEVGLKMAIEEVKREIELREGIKLYNFQQRYYGLEIVKIPSSEDIRLNDNRIHIEVFVNKQKTTFIR
jgi:hypothetical protein